MSKKEKNAMVKIWDQAIPFLWDQGLKFVTLLESEIWALEGILRFKMGWA